MTMVKGYRALLDKAYGAIKTATAAEADAAHDDPDTVFVDVRDVRERARTGGEHGKVHAHGLGRGGG